MRSQLISSCQTNNGAVVNSVNFTSADVTNSGLYTCEAFNDAGRVSHASRLNVFGPLFIRAINNLTALAGDPYSMTCPFGGYPYDSIQWKRGKKIV